MCDIIKNWTGKRKAKYYFEKTWLGGFILVSVLIVFLFPNFREAIFEELQPFFTLSEFIAWILFWLLLIFSIIWIVRGFLSPYEEEYGEQELYSIMPARRKEILEFYSNNQNMIRYHGERMWDSIKNFGIIIPAVTGILTFVINYLSQNGNGLFGKDIPASFVPHYLLFP